MSPNIDYFLDLGAPKGIRSIDQAAKYHIIIHKKWLQHRIILGKVGLSQGLTFRQYGVQIKLRIIFKKWVFPSMKVNEKQ